MSVAIPTENDSAQEHFQALRTWIDTFVSTGHPVRDSAYRMAMSSLGHRILKFGPDESLNNLTAKDLLCLLLYSNGTLAEYLMRVAYFRSLIEGEHEIYERFNQTLFIPECRAWYWKLSEALMSKAPDPAEVTAWVDEMTGEEKGVAHLIIGRLYPDLAALSWLDGLETISAPGAKLASELVRILAGKHEYKAALERYLREHPHVRYA